MTLAPNLINTGLLSGILALFTPAGGLLLAQLSLPSKDTLFALSLFPYLGFLWFLTRSRQAPRLALIGFYTTLVFVGVTIPAGIYARVVYQQALANVDWLHGSAEVFLTLANILIVLGFRQAVLDQRARNRETSETLPKP